MKKRVLSVLLVLAMMVGSIGVLPIHAADHSANFGMKVVGVEDDDKEGLTMSIYYKGADLVNVQSIFLSVDASKLKMYGLETGTEVAITSTRTKIASSQGSGKNAKAIYDPWTDSDYFYALEADGRQLYLIQLGFDSANDMGSWDPQGDSWGEVMQFYLKYEAGMNADKLDKNTIKLVENTHAAARNESAIIVMKSAGTGDLYYGSTNTTLYQDNIAAATFDYPNCTADGPAPDLTGITFDIDKTNVDLNGTAAGSVAVSNVKPVPADANLGTVEYSVAGGTGAKGVSINKTTGAVTVAKDATEGTFTITAKSGTVTATKDFTVTRLNKGVINTFTVSLANSGTATLKPTGGANDMAVTVTQKDVWGTATSETVTVSGTPTGVTYAGGKLSFDNTARATATNGVTLTFSAGSKTATVTLKINKGAAPAAPNVTAVKTTTVGGSDGKITGVNTTMEWKKSTDSTYTAVTGTEITGLTKGDYNVRVAETDFTSAGTVKTVSVGEPGKTDTPTVSIAPATLEIAEGGNGKLTATVTPATGTITYKWYKDNVEVSGQTTNELTVTEAGTYKVEVTREATGESVSDAAYATATVTTKSKTNVVVAKKESATQYEGALEAKNLVTVTSGTWDQVKNAVTADVYKYIPAVEADAENGIEAVPASYEKVTGNLTEGTYYVDVAVAAITDQEGYKVDAVAGAGAPNNATAPADLTGYVTLTVSKKPSGGGGSTTTKFTVTYDAGKNGKLDGSASERVESGKNPTKVPNVVANAGYKFVGWTQNGKSVKPASVKITANTTFVAQYEAAAKTSYIQGIDDTHFGPSMNATRGQLAMMLARLSKDFDASKTYTGKAADVENGKWYTNAVNFAINQGIMNGFEDGLFRPTENIRRGEFSAMLARYLGLKESKTGHFADVTDHWAAGYINALAEAGIVDGFEDGSFRAQNLLTRAEAVKMINRAVEMKYDSKATYDKTFVDVARGSWYYEYAMPAANFDVTDYQR